MTRPSNNKKKRKKENKKIRESAELRTLLSWLTTVNLKESKEKDKLLELAGELKKL